MIDVDDVYSVKMIIDAVPMNNVYINSIWMHGIIIGCANIFFIYSEFKGKQII